jgi:hypothetical protein
VKPDLGFVCCLSSIKQLPECHFYALIHNSNEFLPSAQFQYRIRLQPAIATPISSIPDAKMLEGHSIAPDSTQPDVPMSPAPNQLDPSEQPLVPEELFSHGFCEVPLPDGKTILHCLVSFGFNCIHNTSMLCRFFFQHTTQIIRKSSQSFITFTEVRHHSLFATAG